MTTAPATACERRCGSKVAVRPDDPRDDADVAVAMETGELPPITRDPSKPLKRPRFRPVRLTLKLAAFVLVIYIFVLPLIPGFRDAAHELTRVDPTSSCSAWRCRSRPGSRTRC